MNLENLLNIGKNFFITTALASTILFGCKKEPLLEPSPHPSPTKLYKNVNILKNEDLRKVISYDSTQIKFSKDMNYHTGDILAGGQSEKIPGGFLLKIKSIEDAGRAYKVEQASFDQAIERGKFHFSKMITDEKKGTNGRIEFNISDLVLYDLDGNLNTKDDQISMSGGAYISPTIILDAEWNNGLKNFKFGFESEIGVNIYIGNSLKGNKINKQKILPGPNLPSFPITICGLPSVVQPKLEFIVGVEGEVSPSSISIREKVNNSSTIIYKNHTWSFQQKTEKVFTFEKFVPPENLELKGYVKPKISFLVDYVLGPSASVDSYLKAEANAKANPSWEVKAGMEIFIGADMQIFGKKILNYNKKVWGIEKIIAQAEKKNTPPVAEFKISPDSGKVGAKFTFDASSSHDAETPSRNLEVRWDLQGDGVWDTPFSKNKIVRRNFGASGDKKIVLMVWDGKDSDTTSRILHVYPLNTPPIAKFDISPKTGNVETIFTFDASASHDTETPSDSLQVRWDWNGDGNWDTKYSAQKVAKNKFSSEGNKTVILEVKDEGGLEKKVSKVLNVNKESKFKTFSDPRDDQSYKIVKIGAHWWFAENLNYSTPNSDPSDFGRSYSFEETRAACPKGWHLPSYDETLRMFKSIDPTGWVLYTESWRAYGKDAGWDLKEKGEKHWKNPTEKATDKTGFNALPLENGGDNAYFWTSTSQNTSISQVAWTIELNSEMPNAILSYWGINGIKYPLRPIQNY